jgi:hypothetical protein
VITTGLRLVGLVGLSVVRMNLGLVMLSGGRVRVLIVVLVVGGLVTVLVVLLVVLGVVSLALAEADVRATGAGGNSDVCQRTLAFNAASLANFSVLGQLGQIFAVELNITALGADGELQVGLLGELDLSVTRSGVDVNEGSVLVQLVADALNLEVAEVNRGEQEVRVEVDFFFEHNVAEGDGTRVSDGGQLTNTNVPIVRYALVFTEYNVGLERSIIL